MPQLDPTWYVSQLFWLCISFFTMLFIMSKFIVPRIADILDKRRNKIDDYLYKAKENKRLAEESLEKYHQAIADATQKADLALEEMQKELDKMVTEKQAALDEKLNQRISESEAKINQSKQEALDKIKSMSAELAVDVAKKVGLTHISEKEINKAVDALAQN